MHPELPEILTAAARSKADVNGVLGARTFGGRTTAAHMALVCIDWQAKLTARAAEVLHHPTHQTFAAGRAPPTP